MHAGREQQHGRGVPQIVKANIGQACLLEQRFDDASVKMCSS